jgi:hypothetical protein
MSLQLARRWRQIRLGAAFVEFGLAALAVAFAIAPVVRRRAATGEEAELAVQSRVQQVGEKLLSGSGTCSLEREKSSRCYP